MKWSRRLNLKLVGKVLVKVHLVLFFVVLLLFLLLLVLLLKILLLLKWQRLLQYKIKLLDLVWFLLVFFLSVVVIHGFWAVFVLRTKVKLDDVCSLLDFIYLEQLLKVVMLLEAMHTLKRFTGWLCYWFAFSDWAQFRLCLIAAHQSLSLLLSSSFSCLWRGESLLFFIFLLFFNFSLLARRAHDRRFTLWWVSCCWAIKHTFFWFSWF